MSFKVTRLRRDGGQTTIVIDHPNYQIMEDELERGNALSYIISLNKDVK